MIPLPQTFSKLLMLVFGLIVSCLPFTVSANHSVTKNITFNKQELAYLKNNPILKVNVDKAWFPFNFVENGQVKGYSNEMIQLVAAKVGLSVEFVTGYQRSDYLNMLKTGEIDLISNIKVTPEREKSLIFTQYNPLKVINSLLTLSGHSDYVDFNLERVLADIRVVNPDVEIFQVSATTGEGMDQWYDWLIDKSGAAQAAR